MRLELEAIFGSRRQKHPAVLRRALGLLIHLDVGDLAKRRDERREVEKKARCAVELVDPAETRSLLESDFYPSSAIFV